MSRLPATPSKESPKEELDTPTKVSINGFELFNELPLELRRMVWAITMEHGEGITLALKRKYVGGNYMGDNYVGNNYLGINYLGNNHLGNNYLGNNHLSNYLSNNYLLKICRISQDRGNASLVCKEARDQVKAIQKSMPHIIKQYDSAGKLHVAHFGKNEPVWLECKSSLGGIFNKTEAETFISRMLDGIGSIMISSVDFERNPFELGKIFSTMHQLTRVGVQYPDVRSTEEATHDLLNKKEFLVWYVASPEYPLIQSSFFTVASKQMLDDLKVELRDAAQQSGRSRGAVVVAFASCFHG